MKRRLVLGGGGTSGILAHAAALAQLRRRGVEVATLGGVSAGAVAAAVFAVGMDVEAVALELLASGTPLEHPSPSASPYPCLYSGVGVRSALGRLLPRQMGQVQTPLSLVAVNLSTRQQVVFDSRVHFARSLPACVYASMAVPGVFPPARVGDYLFVDGGLTSNVPAADLYGAHPDVLILRVVRRGAPETPHGPAEYLAALVDASIEHGTQSDLAGFGAEQVIELPITGDLVDFNVPRSRAASIMQAARGAVEAWVDRYA